MQVRKLAKHRQNLLNRNWFPAKIHSSLHCCNWYPTHSLLKAKKFAKQYFLKFASEDNKTFHQLTLWALLNKNSIEQDRHDIYMEQKGKLVFGRDKEINKMMSFAKGLPPQDSTDEVDKERHHMIVVADPGEGKSSLMARFVMEAKKVK